MKKNFTYWLFGLESVVGIEIEIEKTGYGQYIIRGGKVAVHCTDSEIWDWCDDEENPTKMKEAQRAAFRAIVNSDSYNEE